MKAPRKNIPTATPSASVDSLHALAGQVSRPSVDHAPDRHERERILERDREAKQLTGEIRAGMVGMDIYRLGIMRAALDVAQSQNSCGVMVPLEALIADLLILQHADTAPSLERLEFAFEEFRANFQSHIDTARVALRRYPDLVKAEGGNA